MIVNGRLVVESYFQSHRSHSGLSAARRQFDAWLVEATAADWKNPAEVKAKYATASIVSSSRVVFNISGNKYRLVTRVSYAFGVIDIRFFGSHAEYDEIDVEAV